MLQSIVGPPLTGPTDLKSSAKDFKGSDSKSSFGKALEERISKPPKETQESSKTSSRPRDERKEVAEASTDSPRRLRNGDVGKKTQRQMAIKEFMDSFESEFQISPTRLVEAMAELDDQQLAQAPEESAEDFIAQLGLSKEDSDKAQALYAGLLVQLQQISKASSVPAMAAGEGGLSAGTTQFLGMNDRVAAYQEKQDVLNASLDRLTQSFWKSSSQQQGIQDPLLKSLPAQDQMSAMESALAEADLETPGDFLQKGGSAQVLMKELPPHLQGQMKEVASPALLAALAQQQALQGDSSQQSQEIDGQQLKDEFSKTAYGAPVGMPMARKPVMPVNSESSASTSDLLSQMKSQFAGGAQGKALSAGSDGFTNALNQLDSKISELKDSLSGIETGQIAHTKTEVIKGGFLAPGVASGAQIANGPSETEQQAAVQQLLKQAQFLVKKGGGEMNVKMTPEGLGTIHLKVMLQDGKVNLQMSADTSEAKKTIESSLADLKTSLAAQKLSMDNVKVDVVGQTSTDTATQNQNQSQSSGQGPRDQTRQFWNQFNENFGSQGRRESLNEVPSLRSYGAKRDPLQPIEASQNRSTRRVEGKGSGINLVA